MSYAKQAVTRLTLDMGLPDVQKSVSVTRGDTNRRLEVTLIDKGSPFALPPDWTAVLAGVLPGGDELYGSCIVDDGRIIFDFVAANAVSSEEGVFAVAFDVFDEGGEVVASPKLWVHVTPGVRRLSDPDTVDRLTALQEFVGQINRVDRELAAHTEQIGALEGKITTAGTVTIPVSEWTDAEPTMARVTVSGVDAGSIILMLPADEKTRLTANNAKLSAYPVAFTPVGGDSSVSIFRAEAETIPGSDMTFTYLVLKTGITGKSPVAAIIGVDASGGGGVDQSAVEDTVRRLIPDWALEEEPPEERDPSVYNWAKAATKPSYTAAEVGADPAGKAAGLLSAHNVNGDAHNDIRMLVEAHREEVNALLDVDDSTLNELSEIVAYIKSNKSLIDSITDSKVSKTDIVNNLTTNVTNKPLSAAQGVAIKSLIDAKIGTENLAEEVAAQIEAAKENGELGVRGPGVLKVSTTPTSYTTAIGGKNPIKRMSIATIKKEAAVDEVIIGDNIQNSTYLYRIYYLDDTYAYMDTAQNLKGSQGSVGSAGKSAYKYAQDGGYEGTEAEFAQMLASGGSDAVPDYITAEAERVAKAVQATRTAKSLVFPVMSDFHLFAGNSAHDASLTSAQYAGMGIRELKKRMHIDFNAYLGDYTWGADDHTAEQVMKDITAVKETTDTTGEEIWCVGNHDLNGGKNRDRLLTLDEVYSHIGANSDGAKPYSSIERGYGYLDFANQKIRVVYLNTCDTSEWKVTEGAEARADWISPTQTQWLANTALDFSCKETPSEWGVVILGHHPLHYGASCYDAVMQILEAYRDGSSGSLSCTVRVDTADDGTVTYPQQVVTYDFSAGDRAEIICNIHGHNHNCGASKISSTTRTGSDEVEPWLWRFCIPNISANRYNTGYDVGELYAEFDENGNPVYWPKETGTAKATSFCVVNIDRKNKKIHAHIFGAGRDRVMDYGDPYVNQLDAAGYTPDTYLSSSSGNTSAKAGYGTTGFIPIGYGSSNTGTGEQVVYLDGIEALPTDNYVRIAFYDADKSYFAVDTAASMKDTPTESGSMYTLNENGYIKSIDVTAITSYWHKNQGKTTAFFRFCAPGIDGDSIITVNEPIT